MNSISILILKILRKSYSIIFGNYRLPKLQKEEDPDKASEMIYNLLSSDKPCMIARFGANELNAVINYLSVNSKKHSIIDYIRGRDFGWWWNKGIMKKMQTNAGFFPSTTENLSKFGEMMINDVNEVDLLGSWRNEELYIVNKDTKAVKLFFLEPYRSKNPWSRILKNKNILVIHPFSELIEKQYKKREFLFENKDTLPEFNLKTIKAVQSIGGNSDFKDWFEALNWMKNEMDKIDYDICLIGCGAYGFPLAAHAKRKGKKAVHLGGALQLLFGIWGKRWENPNHSSLFYYPSLLNSYWVRPGENETPKNANTVENGCYW